MNNSPQEENSYPFYKRFYLYQKERFPFLAHGLLITAFTFSAVSYSRMCRNQEGFIRWQDFIIGIFATITLFFLVRIFDEFKDKEDDANYRKYLPVPRGLIQLSELKRIGWIVGLVQIAVLLIFQIQMLYLYLIVIAYLLLMGVEFFVPKWLKKRQMLYVTSHMFIIPLIDIYASGLDWLLEGASPHFGLLWFFSVSYMNGLVLEFGRKLRTPESEEKGVVSYTKLYGTRGGTLLWLTSLSITLALAIGAANYANYGAISYIVFGSFFLLSILPALSFIKSPTVKKSKYIEYASAIWTILMYFSLGAIPMLKSLL